MYDKMNFGLMNVGATFQRVMDIAFVGEKENFVVIYLDDIIVFSKSDDEHLKNLKQIFLKSKKIWIVFKSKEVSFFDGGR